MDLGTSGASGLAGGGLGRGVLALGATACLGAEAGLGPCSGGPRALLAGGRRGRRGRPTKGLAGLGAGAPRLLSNNDWAIDGESWELPRLLSSSSWLESGCSISCSSSSSLTLNISRRRGCSLAGRVLAVVRCTAVCTAVVGAGVSATVGALGVVGAGLSVGTETSETVGLKSWEDVYSVSGEGWALSCGVGERGGGWRGWWQVLEGEVLQF